MVIKDRLYGKVRVDSAAIIELIDSAPLQRLKGIGQFGIPDEYYHKKGFSRYDHSVGVMLLLKRLGASEEEQIAGLLHDVSHTAFSHTIDFVVGEGGAESYQDEQHENYVKNTEIPGILKQHGYAMERIIDYHHFGLLERDTPDLCADRVDYSLREFPDDAMRTCLAALAAKDNRIVFINQTAAHMFARNYLKLQSEHWGGAEAVARYRIFADVLRQALKEDLVTMADLWHDDDFVMHKLTQSPNKEIQRILDILRKKSLAHLGKSDQTVFKKFRHVDPHFIDNGKLVRLRDISQIFADELEQARQLNQLGVQIPDVSIA